MKTLKVILIFCLISTAFSSCRKSEESGLQKFREGLFYYNILPYEEQLLYDEISSCIENFEKSTSKIKLLYSKQEFNNVINSIICDNPMFFYVNFGKSELTVQNEKTMVTIAYYDEEYNINNKLNYVNTAVEKIIEKLNLRDEAVSEIEKEISIHDYIVKNFRKINYEEETEDKTVERSLYTAVATGEADSFAYASMFKILMNAADIECYIIQGKAANSYHVWNMAKIQDDFYFTDVLFNDSDIDFLNNPVFHAYFNLGYEKMSRDHIFDNAYLYEDINNIYTYYDYKNLYADTEEKLYEILCREINRLIEQNDFGSDAFEIYSDLSDEIFEDAIYRVIEEINIENEVPVLKEQYRVFNESNVLNAQYVQIFFE